MRSRFLISSSLTDLAAWAVAASLASLSVYGVWLPWNSLLGNQVFPMLAVQAVSITIMSIATARMSGYGVPRPTYGRMFAIFFGTTALTALFLVLFRDVYFSRRFLIFTSIGWLVLATAHRMVRRRRPWTERIGLITGEKQLAEDLAESPHTDVVWVLDPSFDGPIETPDRDLTLAVDLRATLSEKVAQFLSSCDIAGYTIRPLTSIYEEHTGRVPFVHLAEGWEISAPLLAVAPWLPGKRVFDVLITAVTAPLWLSGRRPDLDLRPSGITGPGHLPAAASGPRWRFVHHATSSGPWLSTPRRTALNSRPRTTSALFEEAAF